MLCLRAAPLNTKFSNTGATTYSGGPACAKLAMRLAAYMLDHTIMSSL